MEGLEIKNVEEEMKEETEDDKKYAKVVQNIARLANLENSYNNFFCRYAIMMMCMLPQS